MGRSFDNPEVQKLLSDPRQMVTIRRQTRGTKNSLVLVLNEKEYTPEAISSEILKKLCADAGASRLGRIESKLSHLLSHREMNPLLDSKKQTQTVIKPMLLISEGLETDAGRKVIEIDME